MSQSVIFTCPITKYKIEFIINSTRDTALLNLVVCDYVNMNAFVSLLRSSIIQLMNKNVKTIMQTVTITEWEMLLEGKTTWEQVSVDMENSICDIRCSIDDFLHNFGIGIGLIE